MTIRHTLKSSLFLFLCLECVLAQGSTYPEFFVDGIKEVVTNRTHQIILSGAGIAVYLLHPYDQDIKDYSQKNGLLNEDFSHLLDLYGGGVVYPSTLVGVGVVSTLQGDTWEEGIRKYKYIITSLGLTATLTSAIKILTGRERPNGKGRRSFPSGHTSGSFAIASVLDELYGAYIGLPAYIIAGLVGVQRIHDNKHWLTDVIAGAALGTTIGRGFGAAYRREVNGSPLSIVPSRAGGDFYIRFVFLIN